MPFEFYRLETGSKEEILKHDLHICWKCHADLRNFIVPANDTTLIKYQSYVDSSIKYGYNKHTNYSFLYFQVLIPLASKMLSNSKNWGRIRKAAEKYFDLEITRFNNLNSLNSRRQVLPLAFQMLENWPENWLNIRETYEIRYSDFSKDLNWNVPHWFYKSFI